ncbi:MAG: restriction endonuclease subunit S [Clostridium sp.]
MARTKKQKLSLDELIEQALVKEEEMPYNIPSNWVWTTLDNVAEYKKGPFGSAITKSMFVPKGKNTYKVYEQGNAIRKDKDYGSYYISEDKYQELKGFTVYPNDLIVSCAGTVGEIYKLPENIENGIINQALMRIKVNDNINIKFYLLYFSESLKIDITGKSKGTAIKNIPPFAILKNMPFPLPPADEQQRIVKIVKSLFQKLDKAQEIVQNALNFFESRKTTILHKAFTGELTAKWREENVTDIPEEIFDNIKRERMEMDTCSKEVRSLLDNYCVQEMTNLNNWIRIKAMAICDNITCGGTPTGHVTENGEIPFLKVYNIVNNSIDFQYRAQFISSEVNEGKLKSSRLNPGDVVMNIVGPPLRKIAIIPKDYQDWNMNQAIVRFRTIPYVNNKYMYYCLLNRETLDLVIDETKGVVGQANISITQSRNLEIPIPSKREQEEIVRILDNILENEQRAKELCNVIEKIDTMKKSILARAFRGELGTNNPEEESAVELLREILKENIK